MVPSCKREEHGVEIGYQESPILESLQLLKQQPEITLIQKLQCKCLWGSLETQGNSSIVLNFMVIQLMLA